MRITRTNEYPEIRPSDYPIFIVYTDECSGSTFMFVYREFKTDRESDNYIGVDECANIVKWENEKMLLDDPSVNFLLTGTKLEIEI